MATAAVVARDDVLHLIHLNLTALDLALEPKVTLAMTGPPAEVRVCIAVVYIAAHLSIAAASTVPALRAAGVGAGAMPVVVAVEIDVFAFHDATFNLDVSVVRASVAVDLHAHRVLNLLRRELHALEYPQPPG